MKATEKTKTEKGKKKMSEPYLVELTTVFDKDKAIKLKAVLDGQTYFNIRTIIEPSPGGFIIYAETFHVEDHTEDEFKNMLFAVLTEELIRRGL
jgi:hypothetical protein